MVVNFDRVSYFGHLKFNEPELAGPINRLGDKVDFVVFVLPNNQLQRYAAVKKLFVLKYGSKFMFTFTVSILNTKKLMSHL